MNRTLLAFSFLSLFILNSCEESGNSLGGSTSSDDDKGTVTLKTGALNSGGVDTIYSIDTVFVVDTTSKLDSNSSSPSSSFSTVSSSSHSMSSSEIQTSSFHWVSSIELVDEKGVYYHPTWRRLSVMLPNTSGEIWTVKLPDSTKFDKLNLDLDLLNYLDLGSNSDLEIKRNLSGKSFSQLLDMQVMFALDKNRNSIKLPSGEYQLSLDLTTSKSLKIIGRNPELTTINLSSAIELNTLSEWYLGDLTFKFEGDKSKIVLKGSTVNSVRHPTTLILNAVDIVFSNSNSYAILAENNGVLSIKNSDITSDGVLNGFSSFYIKLNNFSLLKIDETNWTRTNKMGLFNAYDYSSVEIDRFRELSGTDIENGYFLESNSQLKINNSTINSKLFIYLNIGETHTLNNNVYTFKSYNSGLYNGIEIGSNLTLINKQCVKSWNQNNELSSECL